MYGLAANSTAPCAAVPSCLAEGEPALAVLALSAGGRAGGPGQATIPTRSEEPDAMHFEWVREGPAEKCGNKCKEWISAHGVIMPDTGREFEAFARTRDIAGQVMVLEFRAAAPSTAAWCSAAPCGVST